MEPETAAEPPHTVSEPMEDDGGMNPMPVEASHGDLDWREWMEEHRILPRKYKLVTDKNSRKYSMWALRFAVVASAINTKMLNPNYPIMVSPGAHPDSFPDTEPFDFNSATYFIPMMSLLGVAISSIFVGTISDKFGRKKPLLIMAIISTAGSIVKYYTRSTFWGFCISQLVFGFFLGNLPIAMAYVGDIYSKKLEKEQALGVLVGIFVMGNAGGGMIAILMESSGLFAPLWVGAGLMAIASVLIVVYLIEPGDNASDALPLDSSQMKSNNDDDDEDDIARPAEIDQKAMWNVIFGALADNFGSTALFPLCLSPLALEQYFLDFVDAGEEPIMSLNGYKWLSVCVALMVVPSTMFTPYLFNKIGASGTCVFGNLCTAALTIALLLIGSGPATTAAFAGFVTVLYGGFPFTVFSQLTTGPMLDVLAPTDKIGYVQGLNNSAMNFGMAVAPWIFGILADATTTNTAIWTGIGISFLAAAINAPLMWRPEMGPPKKKPPAEARVLPGEDSEVAKQALDGEFIPADLLYSLNRRRMLTGKPFIVGAVTPYEKDKESLDELMAQAQEGFRFRMDLQDNALSVLDDPEAGTSPSELCDLLNASIQAGDPEVTKEQTANLGQWVGDYLLDNGYHPHVQSVMVKQMMLSAFPTITHEKEYTPENMEEALVRRRQIMKKYIELQERKKYSFGTIVGGGGRPQFYS